MTTTNNMKTVGVVVGRFQPLHNGHVNMIQRAIDENDQVIIVVGSMNKAPDYKNPLPWELRKEMIEEVTDDMVDWEAIEDHGIDTMEFIKIIPLKDFKTDQQWNEALISIGLGHTKEEHEGKDIALYTSEKDADYYRASVPWEVVVVESMGLNATDVRMEWYSGGVYENNVPDAVADYLDEFPTAERKRLAAEFFACNNEKHKASSHPYDNAIYPVAHTVLLNDGHVFVIKRDSVRGGGQWAFPGGFVEKYETTQNAMARELWEETQIDLGKIPHKLLATTVSENLGGISVRTIAHNGIFVLDRRPAVQLEDLCECTDFKWVPVMDICEDKEILFYNHNEILRDLLTEVSARHG